EGGMTTGEPLIARVAMKPSPTLTKPLRSVDIATREPAQALRERTDSCVVPAAGAALGVKAMDTDRALEQRLGASIDEYFASHGERAFREAEEDLVAEFLERPPAPVLSLGGGAIGSPRVRELLQRHTVVLLHVDEATAWRRAGGKRRPLARDRERFAALHAERGPVYESLADAILLDGGADTIRAASPVLRA